MRKLVLAIVAAFGLGGFAGIAQAGGGCSHGYGETETLRTTESQPPLLPIQTTTVTPTEKSPG